MRWDSLFNDMESQFAEGDRLSLEAEVTERARIETAAVHLADRLRGSLGAHVAVHLACRTVFEGTLSHAGADALVLNEARHQVLIPYAAAARYVGLGRLSVGEPSVVRRGIGLSHALRGLARDRAQLTVTLRGGSAQDSGLLGVIDRVGRDFFDLASLSVGEARRASQVKQVSSIPFGALGAIRSPRT
ncbi:hypothetical protein J7E83_06965 [Arthrobacter sp. ISL-48]|uniref:hypothetical protein n=1 Tax=Arthrobacter sp. ISL-48 TaxID=2819110 RepID=UPI001BE53319|nr:hypothetical protein [Arthrobacter sp. ISL-48]MBT2531867.1 hypothetical protein [Arthrobacter sp. ISL-48]